jgi:hypothetical protein
MATAGDTGGITDGPTLDGVPNGSAEIQPATAFESKENGTKVNGKGAPISAAQRKREKRKQRKREGSVISESDTESVHPVRP